MQLVDDCVEHMQYTRMGANHRFGVANRNARTPDRPGAGDPG